MKLFFTILSTVFLSQIVHSQIFAGQQTQKTIELSELSGVHQKDFYLSATAPILFPTIKLSESSFLIDPGFDLRVSHLTLGTIDFNYSYSIFLSEIGISLGGWANNLDKHNINISYALPFWQRIDEKSTSVNLTMGNAYTIVPSHVLYNLSFQAGYRKMHTVSTSYTVAEKELAELAEANNSSYSFSTSGWVSQNVQSFIVGLKFDKIFNTNLTGTTDSNVEMEGRKSSIWSITSNLHLGMKSEVAPTMVELHYGLSSTDHIDYQADPSTLPFRKVGFSIGSNYTHFNPKNRVLSSRIGLELGVSPGYNESFISGRYFMLKFVGIGFGFMSAHKNPVAKN